MIQALDVEVAMSGRATITTIPPTSVEPLEVEVPKRFRRAISPGTRLALLKLKD